MKYRKKDNIKKITIIGSGPLGTALAVVAAENYPHADIVIFSHEKSVTLQINNMHTNINFVPDYILPKNISAVSTIDAAVENTQLVLITVPSKSIIQTLNDICSAIDVSSSVIFAYFTKGFVMNTDGWSVISDVIKTSYHDYEDKFVSVYGPCHPIELIQRKHTIFQAFSVKQENTDFVIEILSNDFLHFYKASNVRAMEFGSAVKNVLAIAAGILSMLPACGENISGVLFAEGFKEIEQIAESIGINKSDLTGTASLGDLAATFYSFNSRNKQFGKEIFISQNPVRGKLPLYKRFSLFINSIISPKAADPVIQMRSLAEGAYAVKSVISIANQHYLIVPIFRALHDIITGRKRSEFLLQVIINPETYYRDTFDKDRHIVLSNTGIAGKIVRFIKGIFNFTLEFILGIFR